MASKTNSMKDCMLGSDFNLDANKLPLGLFSPESNGVVYWLASLDKDGVTYTTNFFSETDSEREVLQSSSYDSIEKVFQERDVLLAGGWRFMKQPTMKTTDEYGRERDMTRKEKRYFGRGLQKFAKKESKREGH